MIENVIDGISPEKSVKLNHNTKKKGGVTPVQSIFRATNILRCIMNDSHSIKDIAANCGLSIATVYRILRTLEESELVYKDPVNRKYYLGTLFVQLSLDQVSLHQHLVTESRDEVHHIWELFGEFTAFDVFIGMQKTMLIVIPNRYNYAISRKDDCELKARPLFGGSEINMLVAQYSDDEIEVILDRMMPKGPPYYGVTDKDELKERLKETRLQGYYITRSDDGIISISVPVAGYLCPAALSIVGPEVRLASITSKVIQEMQKSASRISERISRSR